MSWRGWAGGSPAQLLYNSVVSVVPVLLSNVDQLTAENELVVLDFWAAWCRPCSQFAPVFESVSEKFPEYAFGSVNTDQQQGLARRFMVQSLPTVIVAIKGNVVFRRAGVMTGRELERVVRQFSELI